MKTLLSILPALASTVRDASEKLKDMRYNLAMTA